MSLLPGNTRRLLSGRLSFVLCGLFSSVWLITAGEPEYEGKPVSHWLSILRNPSTGSTNREAIRAGFRQAHAAVLSMSFRYAVESPQEDFRSAQSLYLYWLNDYLRPTPAEREMAARVFATALRDSDEEIRNKAAEQ